MLRFRRFWRPCGPIPCREAYAAGGYNPGGDWLTNSQVGLFSFCSVNVRFAMELTDAENQGETCILALGDVIGVRLTDAVVDAW